MSVLLCTFVAGFGCSVPGDEDADGVSSMALTLTNDLVANPSFEQDLSSWTSWQGSLSRVARSDSPDGHYVAKVTQATGRMYSINDTPYLLKSVSSGASYDASAYVRAASPGAVGKPVTLIVRERSAQGQQVKLWPSAVTDLSLGFAKLVVTAIKPGTGNQLDLYIVQDDAVSGDAFYVDAVSATASSSGTSTTTTTMLPHGLGGAWTLVFDDEFDGTSLDTSKWSPNWFGDGGKMNNVGTYAANVAVGGGNLVLTLASSTSGALVHTDYGAGRYQLPVGGFTEARIAFPGSGTTDIYNWPAWWASGPNWPAAGEHDIAEGLGGRLTVNYHSPSGSHNQGAVPGSWGSAFHIYGLHRKASSADVYWDGVLVKSYPTDDDGGGQELILNVGPSSPGATGAASQVKVDWVRAWKP
jgi:hypothetical protein